MQGENSKNHDSQNELIDHQDVKLDWTNYTSIEDIFSNDQVYLFIGLKNIGELDMRVIHNMIKKTHFDSALIREELPLRVVNISLDGKDVATVTGLDNHLVVRFENSQSLKSLKELFLDLLADQIVSVGTIYSIEEKFTVRDTKIEARIKTGYVKNNPYLSPESFWQFFLNGECIGRSLIKFRTEMMEECVPTIIMFEIFEKFRRKYFGSNLILAIEDYMFEHGFKKIRLEELTAADFWKKLEYNIIIDNGEKELGHLDDNHS